MTGYPGTGTAGRRGRFVLGSLCHHETIEQLRTCFTVVLREPHHVRKRILGAIYLPAPTSITGPRSALRRRPAAYTYLQRRYFELALSVGHILVGLISFRF